MKPHERVYCRLGVSKIVPDAVGVFAIIDIEKGTDVFEMDTLGEIVEIPQDEVESLPEPLAKLYHDFAPLNEGYYEAPSSFASLTPSWYLNHSEEGNVSMPDDLTHIIALRDIKAGEELTTNYHTYSEIPPNEVV